MSILKPLPFMLILGFACTAESATLPAYQITTLAFPSGTAGTTYATGVNDQGDVVGNFAGPDGDYNGPYPHAFLWRAGSYSQIPAATTVWDINNAGLAVGVMPGGDGTGIIYDTRSGSQSSFHVPGTYYTRIEGINDAGQVVGAWYHGLGSGAFIGHYTDPASALMWNHPYVNHRNESTAAHGIDNQGRISGFVDAPYDITPELPYYVGGYITSGLLGGFSNINPGSWSHLTASNDAGTIVGWYSEGGWQRSFIIENGNPALFMVPLPNVISTAIWDINEQGWLVGGYVQLNEWGQPMNYGFLAKPVPEPETWATLLAGLGLLGWRLQWRPRH